MDDGLVLPGIAPNRTAAFVTACCRAGENLCSDRDVQLEFALSDEAWAQITKNPALGRAIRTEAEKRVRLGIGAKEAAAKYFAKVPETLNTLVADKTVSPKYRIEAGRELRTTALGTDNTTPTTDPADRFLIQINIGTSTARYEFPIKQLPADEDKTIDNDWGWCEVTNE